MISGLRRFACVLGFQAAIAGAASGVEVTKVRPASPEDAVLAETIRKRLARMPRLEADEVRISVERGVVRFEGAVAHLRARTEMEDVASRVRGVISVENLVEVRRIDAPDSLLQLEADRALRLSPRLNGFRLEVSVEDGIAVLAGGVPLALDRERAEAAVSEVPGLREVQNRVTIDSTPVDPEIVRRRVIRRLKDKLLFGGAENLEVDADVAGLITLRGAVATASDRKRAETLTYGVLGVRSVRNELALTPLRAPGVSSAP